MRKLLCVKPFELKILGHPVIKKMKGKNVSTLPLDTVLAMSKEFGKKCTNLVNIFIINSLFQNKKHCLHVRFEIFQTKSYYTVQNINLRL